MSTRACQPHVVYRCYDSEGLLLYIGHTYKVAPRFVTHRNSKHLSSIVLMQWMASRTVVEYPTKWAAAAAESRAIRLEQPLLNTKHQRIGNTAERRTVIYAYVAYANQREIDLAAERVA